MGIIPALFRGGRDEFGTNRLAERRLSRRLGHRATFYRGTLGPGREEEIDRRRNVGAGLGDHRVDAEKKFEIFALGGALLGIGTAMVYPTLLAAIGDVAHPNWRASAVGVYRLWRDFGYAVGALLSGFTADLFGLPVALGLVAALTAISGMVVAVRMEETKV